MAHLLIGSDVFEVEVSGDATRPALILSASLGTDLHMWDGQMAALTKHFRVIRYDTRGHGGSELGDAPVSLARLGTDVLAILDALEIERAHWLGLSMGGAIGLWLLVNAPARIDRAVLANTAPRLGSPEGWNGRILSVLKRGMKENAAATIERWFSPSFGERRPETVERIHEMLRKTTPEGYAACCAALRDMDLRESLDDIAHEVLIVTGTDDPVVPKAQSEAFLRGLAGARHVALEARHMSNIEAEAAFNAAVVQFLTAERRQSRPRSKGASARASSAQGSSAQASSAQASGRVAKAPTPKRASAARRSNPARRPLKAAPAKRTPAKPAKKAAAARRRPAAKKVATRRVPAAELAASKLASRKAPAKKTAAKKAVRKAAASKAPTARRATPITAARVTTKGAKPAAKSAAKKPAKKATSPPAAKKMPGARRKATTKPRRPTGRGKR